MSNNNNFKTLDCEVKDKDSVISFSPPLMLKINELMTTLMHVISSTTIQNLHNNLKNRGQILITDAWLTKGVECEILGTDGKGWKKGKVRIKVSLEFQPDELEIEEVSENIVAESSLDDIRRKLNGVSS